MLSWFIKIIFFLIVLFFALDNMQPIEINFYGLHTSHMHLITFGIICIFIGFIFGALLTSIKTIKSKAKLRKLQNKATTN